MTALRLAVGPLMQQGAGPGGHAGVAAWVAANSADVLAYYPMDDATASGTMADDSGNGRNGTYGSGSSSRNLSDGEAGCDMDGTQNAPVVSYGAWMNDQVAGFAVVEFDNATGSNEQIVGRDDYDGSQRSYQFRRNTTGNVNFIKITGGTVAAGFSTLTQTTQHTVGWWWDGSLLHVYHNGATANVAMTGDPTATTSPMYFGWRNEAGNFAAMNGVLASVVVLGTADANTIPDLEDAWNGT